MEEKVASYHKPFAPVFGNSSKNRLLLESKSGIGKIVQAGNVSCFVPLFERGVYE